MEIESRSSVIKTIIGLMLVAETVLFFLTVMICALRDQLDWNGFLSTLLDVGFLAILLGLFFVREFLPLLKPIRFPTDKDKAREPGCLPTMMLATVGSGFLVIALSILIRFVLPG